MHVMVMNINEIETERAPDCAAPDEDEAQPYNAYGDLDHWGDGSFNSASQNNHQVTELQSKGKKVLFVIKFVVVK